MTAPATHSTITLRPYQTHDIESIEGAWQKHRSVMYQLPTGGGKSSVIASIVCEAARSRAALVVAHRKELIEQLHDRLALFGIDAGVIMAGVKPKAALPVQVASIQTLARRDKPKADLLIIDEAHHATSDSYVELIQTYPKARVLGVSATPCRSGGDGFRDLFGAMVCGSTMDELINDGFLCDYDYYHLDNATTLSKTLSGVKVQMGDYKQSDLSKAMRQGELIANVVRDYLKVAAGKRSVVFAVDVQHSKDIVRRFKREGVKAEHVDGETPKPEREKILKRFRDGETKVLCNVGIIEEGFDLPAIDAVQLAVPTMSLRKHLQQVGRALRPVGGVDACKTASERLNVIERSAKPSAIIVDHVFGYLRHGLPKTNRRWTLDGVETETEELAVDAAGKVVSKTAAEQGKAQRLAALMAELGDSELVMLRADNERLAQFEVFRTAHAQHNGIGAMWDYLGWLSQQREKISSAEIDYIQRRLRNAMGSDFWNGQRRAFGFAPKTEAKGTEKGAA